MDLQKCHGLERGDFEAPAAPLVFAIDGVVDSDQVGAGLGELHAVFLAGVGGERGLLRAPAPTDFVAVRLPAKRTVEVSRFQLILFSVKVAFFHRPQPKISLSPKSRRPLLQRSPRAVAL